MRHTMNTTQPTTTDPAAGGLPPLPQPQLFNHEPLQALQQLHDTGLPTAGAATQLVGVARSTAGNNTFHTLDCVRLDQDPHNLAAQPVPLGDVARTGTCRTCAVMLLADTPKALDVLDTYHLAAQLQHTVADLHDADHHNHTPWQLIGQAHRHHRNLHHHLHHTEVDDTAVRDTTRQIVSHTIRQLTQLSSCWRHHHPQRILDRLLHPDQPPAATNNLESVDTPTVGLLWRHWHTDLPVLGRTGARTQLHTQLSNNPNTQTGSRRPLHHLPDTPEVHQHIDQLCDRWQHHLDRRTATLPPANRPQLAALVRTHDEHLDELLGLFDHGRSPTDAQVDVIYLQLPATAAAALQQPDCTLRISDPRHGNLLSHLGDIPDSCDTQQLLQVAAHMAADMLTDTPNLPPRPHAHLHQAATAATAALTS